MKQKQTFVFWGIQRPDGRLKKSYSLATVPTLFETKHTAKAYLCPLKTEAPDPRNGKVVKLKVTVEVVS